MALMRRGVTDLNTENPELLEQAGRGPRGAQQERRRQGLDRRLRDRPGRARARCTRRWSGDMIAGGHLLHAQGRQARRALLLVPGRRAGRSSTTASASRPRRPSRSIAHRFLNYMLDNKVGYENFAGYVGYQPPLTAIDAQKLFDDGIVPKTLEPGRRHARGLRERQRLPDALGQGPAALGPAPGRRSATADGRRAGSGGRSRRSRSRLAGASSSSSPSTRSSASGWATSPRSTSRSRTGTRWTGTSATSGRR